MPKPPSTDAKWCIEQLFQYIELNIKNRVAAKIGRARSSFEAGKLSNIGNYAALAHPSKALTPLSSSRWRQSSMPINLSAQQRLQLRDVFTYYCSWAEKHNYLYMARTQFLKMCRDCCIMGPRLTGVQLNLIFERVHLECTEPMPGVRLGLNDWLQALLRISTQLFRECSPQEAFDQLVEQHVLRRTPSAAIAARNEDRMAEVMLRQDVLELLHDARVRLRPIFKFYINEQEFLDLSGSGGAWKEVQEARTRMPFNSFVRFAQDFELVPHMLTKAGLSEAFRCSRFGAVSSSGPGDASSEPEDMARIGFEEFVDAVGRLALMAYNYQEEKAEVQNIEFKESYNAAAKRLWLDTARNQLDEERDFPDEVAMPAALLDHALGNEDQPHMDDVMSRAASKVFGKARSTIETSRNQKVMKGPGLEVMAVHAEQPKLPDERPLHLTHFQSDWVGRPGTPLTETSKLRKLHQEPSPRDQGWYSADQDLPPAYKETAQRMIEARVIREQVSEGLRLNYKAEQRRCQMNVLTNARALRQQLQAASGQPLVGETPVGYNDSGELLGSWQESGPAARSNSASLEQHSSYTQDAEGQMRIHTATATSSQPGFGTNHNSAAARRQHAAQHGGTGSVIGGFHPGRFGKSQTMLEEIERLLIGMAPEVKLQ